MSVTTSHASNSPIACITPGCSGEACINKHCVTCATDAMTDRPARSDEMIARTGRSTLTRAERKAEREARDAERGRFNKLAGVTAKYGEDAVSAAILASMERAEKARKAGRPAAGEDYWQAGYTDARGQASHAAVATRARNAREMAYAKNLNINDPTGDSATNDKHSQMILAASSFVQVVPGRRPLAVDWQGLAEALHVDAALVEDVTIGELLATGLYGLDEKGRPATRDRRVKSHGARRLNRLEDAAVNDPAPRERAARPVAELKTARTLQPVRGTGRIK